MHFLRDLFEVDLLFERVFDVLWYCSRAFLLGFVWPKLDDFGHFWPLASLKKSS